MEDGFVIFYCDKGVLYPVALTQQQYDLCQIVIASAVEHKIVLDRQNPQGKAVNLQRAK